MGLFSKLFSPLHVCELFLKTTPKLLHEDPGTSWQLNQPAEQGLHLI